MCQCPQRASTYFYRREIVMSLDDSVSVNALNGLLLISTTYYGFDIDIVTKEVSMPSTGFYLFLQEREDNYGFKKNGVNALNGLLLISTFQN